jgi:hypothetical protein
MRPDPSKACCFTGCKGINNILLKEAAPVKEKRAFTVTDVKAIPIERLLLKTGLFTDVGMVSQCQTPVPTIVTLWKEENIVEWSISWVCNMNRREYLIIIARLTDRKD